MIRNEEILAGITAASPAIRAAFQGQLGYWCQAEAVFIADEGPRPEPGRAIAAYRQRLSEAHIAVNYNGYTDAIARLLLQSGQLTPWQEGLERNRQQLQADYFAMKQRAEAAEAALAAAQTQAAAAEAREAGLREALEWVENFAESHMGKQRNDVMQHALVEEIPLRCRAAYASPAAAEAGASGGEGVGRG